MRYIIITPTLHQVTKKTKTHIIQKNIGGKGKTVKYAYKQVEDECFDFVITMDDDGQHPPEYITPMIEHLINNDFDLVIGSRNLSQYPFYKRISNRVATKYCNWIAKTNLTDSESGFRAMTKKAAATLIKQNPGDHYDFEICMNILAKKNNLKIGEIEIESPWKNGRNLFEQIRDAKKIIETGWRMRV